MGANFKVLTKISRRAIFCFVAVICTLLLIVVWRHFQIFPDDGNAAYNQQANVSTLPRAVRISREFERLARNDAMATEQGGLPMFKRVSFGQIVKELDGLAKYAEVFAFLGLADSLDAAITRGRTDDLIGVVAPTYCEMSVFRKDAYLAVYINTDDEAVPGDLTLRDAIPLSDAKNQAEKLLALLGLTVNIEDFGASLVDRWSNDSGDLRGAEWHFFVRRNYQGYRTSSYIGIIVSAYSGRIELFHNDPFVPPESMKVAISEEEAWKIVKDFAAQRGIPLIPLKTGFRSEMEICYPTSVWRPPNEPFHLPDFFTHRLCYVVNTGSGQAFEQDGQLCMANIAFQVDCETGEIIGGSGPPRKLH